MASDFIHYVKRRIKINFPKDPNDSWFAELQKYDQGFNMPVYHVTRGINGPASVVKPGDTIWLVSQLQSPWGYLSPSLDARIDVKSIEKRRDKGNLCGFKYYASNSSRWFPLYDVSNTLHNLSTKDSKGEISSLLRNEDKPIGQSLQSMRKLTNGEPLRALEKIIDGKDLHFTSVPLKLGRY
ncbi:hypothetical protein EYV94_24590 [Puteibacter caeruleilacunae]|nr:hypothetical protein EYV94_24590 [Puteibacter caeruleilacunae]